MKNSKIGIFLILISVITVKMSATTGNVALDRYYDLLGKVEVLEGYSGIYVGAGSSATGEPMFFAMEKLDSQREKMWSNYAYAFERSGGVLDQLYALNNDCQNKKVRDELKSKQKLYLLELMDKMCPYRQKFEDILSAGGTKAGILGFKDMLNKQKSGSTIYVAYVSTQPISGPFRPKKDIGSNPTIEEFKDAYPDIVISIGVNMEPGTSRTEHRGIFKNPFFDIRGLYKGIAMKLHGWAGVVESQVFKKLYMTVYPTIPAAKLLHQTVKPGDMYIGIDTFPYEDEELGKKFSPIQKELIGNAAPYSYAREPIHVFDLKVLSKYYTN